MGGKHPEPTLNSRIPYSRKGNTVQATQLELGEEEGAGAPTGVPKIAGDHLQKSAHPWCFVPKALTPDTASTPQKAVPRPCCGGSHPAPNQGNPLYLPVLVGEYSGVYGGCIEGVQWECRGCIKGIRMEVI